LYLIFGIDIILYDIVVFRHIILSITIFRLQLHSKLHWSCSLYQFNHFLQLSLYKLGGARKRHSSTAQLENMQLKLNQR